MKAVVRLTAGLANRMFQYSYALYLESNGFDVYIDKNYNPKLPHEKLEWERIFPNAKIEQASKSLIFRLGGGFDILSRIRIHFHIFSKVYMYHNFSSPDFNEVKGDRYYISLFAHHKFADAVKESVMEHFHFASFKDQNNVELQRIMENSNSVAIHFRKGDDYSSRADLNGVCTMEYYNKAIGIIQERVENPKFFVFTDNPRWVKENLKAIEYTLVDHNPTVGWGNHFDMQLMSCCKHNIIANSTYSWWGAYLNPNNEKIVIMPKCWFNPLIRVEPIEEQLLCDGWIAL